jgi:hypothetical protein
MSEQFDTPYDYLLTSQDDLAALLSPTRLTFQQRDYLRERWVSEPAPLHKHNRPPAR